MAASRWLQDLPIRQKLRWIVLVISGLAVAGACGLFVTYQWYTSRERRVQRNEVTADVVGTQAVAALEFQQEEEAAAILKSLRADKLILASAIYRPDGKLFARYLADGIGAENVPAGPEPDGARYEGGRILIFRPMTSEDKRAGTIYVLVDLADIRNIFWTNLAVSLAIVLATSGAILLLISRFGRLITDPIQKLSEGVQTVSYMKDYTARVEGGGKDELGRLIAGFNEMIRAVEEREAALAKARDELEVRVKERTRDLEQEVLDRKAAQKATQDKEAKLIEAQQIAQLGSWEWDPEKNTVDWSDELYRILGVLPTRFGGKYDESLLVVHPDDRKSIAEAMEKSRADREPFQADVRIIRPDGSIRHLRVHGKPLLDNAGKTVKLLGTAQDVTERRLADQAIVKLNEELQKRVEEAADANKELEGFSYSVSHDLRAPLRAIHGYSRMLMEDYADRVDGDGRRFLEVISANTRRMGQLIDDLLDFSRLGRKALVMSPVDMEATVKQLSDEALAASPDRKIEFRIGSLPRAHGDLSILRIALTNLISNAVKYSKGRDPAVIEISGSAGEKENTYVVKDNGVGFEMEYAHKLFGVFQRLHRPEDFEGTGVGLALVQRIIHRHGGRVTAQGAVNAGATFTFTLPRRAEGVGV